MRRRALLSFGIAMAVPLLIALGLSIPRLGRDLTTPREYIALLERERALDWRPPSSAWKVTLAREPRCTNSRVVILGSSRLMEVDRDFLGTGDTVCNLGVAGFRTSVLEKLAQALPTVGGRRLVYLGLDHFLFYALPTADRSTDVDQEGRLFKATRFWGWLTGFSLGQMAADVRAAGVALSARSRPFERQVMVSYPEGHTFRPRYYSLKAEGRTRRISDTELLRAAAVTVPKHAVVDQARMAAFERAVRMLGAKGYALRVFWAPLVPRYLAIGRQSNPALLQQTVAEVERIVRDVGIERYYRPRFDASSFGCTERDYVDSIHVDLDCLGRFFALTFGDTGLREGTALSRTILERRRSASISAHSVP